MQESAHKNSNIVQNDAFIIDKCTMHASNRLRGRYLT
ncbi:hypothetical protein Pat9b_0849 [Pantoea sp. At-9b]|nr:hypothetical protein Pat9b_0849 [Pantoea sp. At-9b]